MAALQIQKGLGTGQRSSVECSFFPCFNLTIAEQLAASTCNDHHKCILKCLCKQNLFLESTKILLFNLSSQNGSSASILPTWSSTDLTPVAAEEIQPTAKYMTFSWNKHHCQCILYVMFPAHKCPLFRALIVPQYKGNICNTYGSN